MFPGGKMVMYTGMLKFLKDDDEVAAVIGHEMGHAIARHGSERYSQATLAEAALTALGAAVGGREYGPAVVAAAGLGAQVGVMLPFSRLHEEEADFIGFLAMAKAGYDPQAAIRLWTRMEKEHGSSRLEFLSTHPNPGTRVNNLQALLPYALKFREQPSLPFPKSKEELPALLKP
jgi:predicted Zn-dependent protease